MEQQTQSYKFLETERLYLRRDLPSDIDIMLQSMQDRETRKMTGAQIVFTRTTVEEWFQRRENDKSRLSLMICLKETDELIGDLEILQIDTTNRNAYIRIALVDSRFFGKGYGPEAMVAILDHAFGVMNLHRIELNVFSYNKRGMKAYEKIGFKVEGVQREALFYDHEYHDSIIMGMLASEFRQIHKK